MEAFGVKESVEELGFGLAQVRVLLLGVSIWLFEGYGLLLITTLASPAAQEFHAGSYQRSLFAMLGMSGLCAGTLLGGYLGDVCGRRPPIIASFLLSTLAAFLVGTSVHYSPLLWMVCLLGVSLGLGLSPSLAMQSEVTPTRWRMVAMSASRVMTSCGCVAAAASFVADDPSLEALNWRRCFLCLCPLSGGVGLLACIFLPESPVFLASAGDSARAAEVLQSMLSLNGRRRPAEPRVASGGGAGGPPRVVPESSSLSLQLQVVFGFPVLRYTLVAMFACFAWNLNQHGHNYAEPLVLVSEKDNMRFAAGWQLLIEQCWTILGALLLAPVDRLFAARRSAAAASFALVGAANAAFAALVLAPKTAPIQVLFEGSALAIRVCNKLAVGFALQISTEMYPTVAAAAGNALCQAFGRLGSIAAPLLFEFVYEVSGLEVAFYYVMAVSSAATALALAAVLPARLEDVRETALVAAGELLPLKDVAILKPSP